MCAAGGGRGAERKELIQQAKEAEQQKKEAQTQALINEMIKGSEIEVGHAGS